LLDLHWLFGWFDGVRAGDERRAPGGVGVSLLSEIADFANYRSEAVSCVAGSATAVTFLGFFGRALGAVV
jgi:hypothetical protein